MGIDQKEAQRRRNADGQKYSPKQPIAAIQKRVIDSPVYAKLPHSARSVLLLLARNSEKGRNGHVFLSVKDGEAHGVDKKTLYRSFRVLTQAGFIFPTSKGGHGKCSTYALTWLERPKDTKGLHLEHYQPTAWHSRDEALISWKKARGRMPPREGQISPQAPTTLDKFPPSLGDKFPHLEVNTNTQRNRTRAKNDQANVARLDAYLAKLNLAGLGRGKHAERISVRLASIGGSDGRAAA